MLYEKQEFTMKNGKTAVLRSPRREDAEAMLLYIRRMSEETEFVGRYPEEITETLESEADFLEQCVESKNSIQISAASSCRFWDCGATAVVGTWAWTSSHAGMLGEGEGDGICAGRAEFAENK